MTNPMILLMTLLVLIAMPTLSETHHDNHSHHGHDTSGFELGMSLGQVDLGEEEGAGPGLHVHLGKRLGHHGLADMVSIGVGGEWIFTEEKHYSLMLSITVYPWKGLAFSVAPGFLWAEHDGEMEREYSTHLEAAYLFELGQFDLGPVVGYSKTADEDHTMIGVHLGWHW